MSLPVHQNPTTPSRTARAPYNFVPLPEVVVPAPPLPERDVYDPNRLTGVIRCTLTTETPLYTRAALEPEEYNRGEKAKDKPDFFYVDPATHKPVIPGSSLRGVLRELLEIVSYSKVQPVTDRRLFFRTMQGSRVKDTYMERMTDNVRGGIFRMEGDSFKIHPCLVGRVPYDATAVFRLFGKRTHEGDPPNRTPNWELQHKQVWVKLDDRTRATSFYPVEHISLDEQPGLTPGWLVITGEMQRKKAEFVFIRTAEAALPVSVDLVKRFHDDDQMTDWQEDAFPTNQPPTADRRRNGWLRNGEPVFYVIEDGVLTFFGRAAKFRLPYRHSPRDMLPDYGAEHGVATANLIDMAEAIFGRVDENASERAQIAGRVYVSDAHVATEPIAWNASAAGRLPHILSSPKPTTVQHYLTQDKPNDPHEIRHYDDVSTETTLRGHKLYWHKQEGLAEAAWAEPEGTQPTTQHTGPIRPIAAGMAFEFNLWFENLSKEELGAVLWVMRLSSHERYRIKLGMAKPYGLGTVKILYTLEVDDRSDRYLKAVDAAGWAAPPKKVDEGALLVAFEHYVLRFQGARRGQARCLSHLPRIRELLAMAAWNGPSDDRTRYMPDPKDFADRKVLPAATRLMHEEFPVIVEALSEQDMLKKAVWRKAKVRRYQPQRGGRLIDVETNEEILIRPDNIITKGYSPPEQGKVEYAIVFDIDGARRVFVRKSP